MFLDLPLGLARPGIMMLISGSDSVMLIFFSFFPSGWPEIPVMSFEAFGMTEWKPENFP